MGQVGQGALADLVTVTKRLAQQDRWRRSAIGNDLNIHGLIIAFIKQKTREARRITWVHKGSKNRANPLLINILSDGGGGKIRLSETYGGRVHDKRIAEATRSPLPAGSQLLQDLGFLAFTLPQVDILMPTKKPRGQELTLEQQLANQALHSRRLRIEHVNSSVKRCRIVKDRIRLWKEGVRDLVMDICCALHNFRVRLTPWQPMI